MGKVRRKPTKAKVKPKKKITKKKKRGTEDERARRKYKRGGRIKAYTFGEASKGKGFPW